MGKKTTKPTAVRRVATGLAVLGALVLSSGVALMVTAGPSNAADGDCVPAAAYTETTDWVTSSPGDGWTQTDERSVLVTPATDPVYGPGQRFSWNSQGPYDESSPAPAWPDPAQGKWVGNTSQYNGTDPIGEVFFHAAGNGNDNGSYFYWERVVVTPGTDAVYRTEYKFSFNHPAVTCDTTVVVNPPTDTTTTTTVVSPPKAKTPKAHTPKAATVTTPTVVHAGLSSVSTQDLRGEQGLALMVAGMVMLVAAGGLGLRLRGAAARI